MTELFEDAKPGSFDDDFVPQRRLRRIGMEGQAYKSWEAMYKIYKWSSHRVSSTY